MSNNIIIADDIMFDGNLFDIYTMLDEIQKNNGKKSTIEDESKEGIWLYNKYWFLEDTAHIELVPYNNTNPPNYGFTDEAVLVINPTKARSTHSFRSIRYILIQLIERFLKRDTMVELFSKERVSKLLIRVPIILRDIENSQEIWSDYRKVLYTFEVAETETGIKYTGEDDLWYMPDGNWSPRYTAKDYKLITVVLEG